jgi:hypothetical protein
MIALSRLRQLIPNWRKRTWAVLVWTAANVTTVIVIGPQLAAPSPPCGPNADAYCNIGAGVADGFEGILLFLLLIAAVAVWATGVGLICLVAWLPGEVAHRRQLSALGSGRGAESATGRR